MKIFKFTIIFATFISAPFLFAASAQAAVLSFDPQERTVGMGSPFLVGITISADVPVNTIRAVIDVPESMEIVDTSDGNSIVNLWIEKPHITQAHQLVFSGIIPGGFEGEQGKLITLSVQAKRPGTYSFIVNPASRILENDETATPQDIIARPLQLSVVEGRDNLVNEIPDTTPPEAFRPVLVFIPDEQEGHWAVSFETQDKNTGIASYEVAETSKNIDVLDFVKLIKLDWNTAESPYVLTDQARTSYIYVKALDKKGNARFGKVVPMNGRGWYEKPEGYILITLILCVLFYVIISRKYKNRT